MAVVKSEVDENHRRLMLAIGDVIAKHTSQSPMNIQGIVGVLAFCAGAAIMRDPNTNRSVRRGLKDMAVANIDYGMDAMRGSQTSLILPGDMH
jgi:hypothetical protein